jgi:3-deoxy-D-manno-octulosonate 8-phosphate phosphatase KdsC-like HAD superfamily phosphatase
MIALPIRNPTNKLLMANKTILVDIDGVLTDGKLNMDYQGEKMFKSFHSRDVAAIRELILNGYRVILVSADNHPSGQYFADKVGAEFVYERDKSKLGESFIAVGDSVWDYAMLRNAKHAFMPKDAFATPSSRPCNVQPLRTEGGKGVMAEIVNMLMTKPDQFK